MTYKSAKIGHNSYLIIIACHQYRSAAPASKAKILVVSFGRGVVFIQLRDFPNNCEYLISTCNYSLLPWTYLLIIVVICKCMRQLVNYKKMHT